MSIFVQPNQNRVTVALKLNSTMFTLASALDIFKFVSFISVVYIRSHTQKTHTMNGESAVLVCLVGRFLCAFFISFGALFRSMWKTRQSVEKQHTKPNRLKCLKFVVVIHECGRLVRSTALTFFHFVVYAFFLSYFSVVVDDNSTFFIFAFIFLCIA